MTPIPLLTQLYTGVKTSLQTQFGITIPSFGKSFFRSLAGVWSGVAKIFYIALGNVQKNIWFDLADPEALGGTLERFGRTIILRNPFPATQGTIIVSVTGSSGAVINAGETALSDGSSLSPGYLYVLDTAYTLTGSGDLITLRALTAGTIANLNVGNTLTFTAPIVNVNQGVAVSAIGTSAIDGETIPEYRAAIALHYQLAPQGGAVSDYRLWGSQWEGVAKIYPYTASGAVWQVNVYVEAILSDSGGTAPYYNYGIPTTTIINGVTSYILTDPATGLARKPMGVVLGPSNAGALAVTVYQVAIAFTGSGSISTADKAIIANALVQAVNNIRPFIAGCDALANQNDTLSISLPASGGRIAAPELYVIVVIAMQAVPGALFTGVSMTVNSVSETSYTFDNGIIPFLEPSNVTFS